MVIESTDDATTFDQETTTVSFSGDAFLFPPLTQVLTKKRIGVFAVITRAGLGTNGTTEVAVTVTTPEGEGTEILTLILLPLI
jgi:hydrogenase maturation factor